MKYLIIISIVLNSLTAQKSFTNFRFGTQANRLIKHSPNLRLDPSGVGAVVDIAIQKTVNGSKQWHHDWNFPRYGLMTKYLYLGHPREALGDAFGIAPFYDLLLHRGQKTNSYLLIGSGFAYNTKIFNIVNNVNQNAISTHINNLTCFEYRYEFVSKKNFNYYAGIGLSHISNGSYKSPNLGLNYFSLLVGINQNKVQKIVTAIDTIQLGKRWILGINYGYAIREYKLSGGPKFEVHNINTELGYFYSKYKLFKLGIDIEQHSFSSYVQSHDNKNENIKDAYLEGIRTHLFTGHEWYLGSTSLETRMGFLLNRNAIWAGVKFYTKLIYLYHIPVKFIPNLSIDLGISIKAQWADAEYMNALMGLRYKF